MNTAKRRRQEQRALDQLPQDPEGPFVYIDYTSSLRNPEDDADNEPVGEYDPRPPSTIKLRVKRLSTAQAAFFSDRLQVDPKVLLVDEVFLVTVRYSDGDSYKTTRGYHKFMGAFATLAEAEALSNDIKAKEDGPSDRDRPWQSSWCCHLSEVEITKHILFKTS